MSTDRAHSRQILIVNAGTDQADWRVGKWSEPLQLPDPDEGLIKSMHWCRRAASEAWSRTNRGDDGFAAWTAAVEGVWWVAALDELLYNHIGGSVYAAARAADPKGKVVLGMRWLRSTHIHDIVVTGAGGPKRPFVGGEPGNGAVLYISPPNRWRPPDDLPPRPAIKKQAPEEQRFAYRDHLVGHPLDATLWDACVWLDRVMSACAIPDLPPPTDPTVL